MYVHQVHDGRDDEVQIVNVVQVTVTLFGSRNGDVFVQRDGTNMLTLDEDEVDAGLLAVLVCEEADALAVFQEAQVYIEPVERQSDFGNVKANRLGLTE